MSSSSEDYTTSAVETRYSHGDGSTQTLCFSISAKRSLSDDDAETFQLALGVLQNEIVGLVEFLKLRKGCTQYYFEYSSKDYVDEYERSESLGEDEIEAEFGIALEITSGCATKMLIRTTDNDVTVPLHFEQAIDPRDAAAIRAFMISALNHGTNPITAGNQAASLQALSRFGRENETLEQPFSLTMLADPQQREAADSWVQMFRAAADAASANRQKITGAVEAFREGYVQARKEGDPRDAAAIKALMIRALNHGTNPITAGSHATYLLALSRFGRKNETLERPFSLMMLADPQQREAADSWVQTFRDAADTASAYRGHVAGAVKAFRAGYVQAREEGDPLDAEAIKAFMISALNHGTNPSTAGNQAASLQALSRFGRENETLEQPFSLTMLADPQQREAADSWVQMFRAAADAASANRQKITGAVEAFREGYVQAREEGDPLDAEAIKAFMISALNHGTNPSTAGNQATSLLALSRFGRENEMLERPFSLMMLADPQQQQAADSWVQTFRDAADIGPTYRGHVAGAVKAFRAGYVQAREEGDPLDAEAIKAFMISALNHGTNPSTAGNQAASLQALSRFGRENETLEQPFSLTMLADPQQREAADSWVQMFRAAADTASGYRRKITGAVKAFCAGYVQAREEGEPRDAAAIKAFMISALNHGTNPSTAGKQATSLLALSRFGRNNETLERPFSLMMLADPQQQEAADSWVQTFRAAADTGSYRQNIAAAVKAFRAGHMSNLNVLPIRCGP